MPPASAVPDPVGVLSRAFLDHYHRSLSDYRSHYDDVAEIGNPGGAWAAFYFVPGISGSPGQMRFSLPSLTRVFGARIYAKALHTEAFSASVPIWDKYTLHNVDEKLACLRADLRSMLRRFDRFTVVCSSNGLYDFLAATTAFPDGALESRVELLWVSCAPDEFGPSRWEQVFFPLNGLVVHGHRWFAYPNAAPLRFINPEAAPSFTWREGHQRRRFEKGDIESRFRCLGLEWDYISSSQLGAAARHVICQIHRPWRGAAEVLIAANDGYWQGTPLDAVEGIVRRYVPFALCTVRKGSHVSVVNPTTLTEMFERLAARLRSGTPRACRRRTLQRTSALGPE